MLWETLLELARQLAAAPPAIAAPVVPEANTAAETKPECVEPHEQTVSDWSQDKEERKAEGLWVWSTKYYSRTVTDKCDGTVTTETKTEGPTRQWPAVPDRRVADVNRPSGTDDAVTGTPLRTSNLPDGVQGAPAVGPQDRPAANKPSLPNSNKPAAPQGSPFYPSIMLIMGVVVAAWQQKRFGGGSTSGGEGPDPEQELLDWKIKHFQSLARRGRWDARNPQLRDDSEFASHFRPWESLKPETQVTLKAWQKQWDSVAGYWERFFADVDAAADAPTVDPWGLGDIARAQAAEALQGKLSQFRVLVDRLAANPADFDDLSAAMQDLGRGIEHFRSVLPSEESENMIRDAFAGDESVVGQLLIDVKRRQYRELAKAGRFENDYPQFTGDAAYAPFALLRPAVDAQSDAALKSDLDAWTDAARFWRAKLAGESTGAEPADVLGIGQFGWARIAAAMRQHRREDADQIIATAPQGSVLDQKRMARWARADQEGNSGGRTWGGSGPAYGPDIATALNIPKSPPSINSLPAAFKGFEWSQEKVDAVWDYALSKNVDPRLLLAIIPQEGTGSWNTSADHPAADGQHGANPDFGDDLNNAMAHIMGKFAFYGLAVDKGFVDLAKKHGLYTAGANGESYGNVIQFINWDNPMDPTQLVNQNGKHYVPESGFYANHGSWNKNVAETYKALGGDVDALSAWVATHFTPSVRRNFILHYVDDNVYEGSGWTGAMNIYKDVNTGETYWRNPDDPGDAAEIDSHFGADWVLVEKRRAEPVIIGR